MCLMFRLTCQAAAGEVTDEEAAPSEVQEGVWVPYEEYGRLTEEEKQKMKEEEPVEASTTKQNKYKQNEMK